MRHPNEVPCGRGCIFLGRLAGVRRWASYERRRRDLVLWIALDGRQAFPVEVPLGEVFSRLGIKVDQVASAMTLWQVQQQETPKRLGDIRKRVTGGPEDTVATFSTAARRVRRRRLAGRSG